MKKLLFIVFILLSNELLSQTYIDQFLSIKVDSTLLKLYQEKKEIEERQEKIRHEDSLILNDSNYFKNILADLHRNCQLEFPKIAFSLALIESGLYSKKGYRGMNKLYHSLYSIHDVNCLHTHRGRNHDSCVLIKCNTLMESIMNYCHWEHSNVTSFNNMIRYYQKHSKREFRQAIDKNTAWDLYYREYRYNKKWPTTRIRNNNDYIRFLSFIFLGHHNKKDIKEYRDALRRGL
ncbi:MAG: hypothetical protein QM528_00900 [Phycisphaerales bacterium]|nr:hypothetical protein [Phycisphaerales bacterium]